MRSSAATAAAADTDAAGAPPRFPAAFELFALAFLVATIAFLRAVGLRVGGEAAAYTLPPLARTLLPIAFLWGPALHALAEVLRWRDPRPVLRRTLGSARWLVFSLRTWIALVAVGFAYTWLKVSIPLVTTRLHDETLWRLDAALHFGVSPSVFAVTIFEKPWLLRAIDGWYDVWLLSTLIGLAWFLGLASARVRARCVTSAVLVWMLGGWLYLAAPALGPCYASPDVWDSARTHLPHATAMQDRLADNYRKMLAGRHGPLPELNPALGVAALPSLHVALHVLLALWAFAHARRAFVLFAAGAALTFVGSVVTGWHYAVDGYVGILLACGAWWAAGRLTRAGPPDDATGPEDGVTAAEGPG